MVFAAGLCAVLLHPDGTSGRHVDAGRPVDLGIELLGDEQRARLAVQRIAEAVAVEMDERLRGLPFDRDVGEDHLVDAVVIPLVMRRHLIDPFRHPGIRVAGEDRH